MVNRLLGVWPADVSKAMQHLNDSLTRLISHDDGDRWMFRHPTVTDAFAELVAGSPELVELYVHGAKLDRLIREVVCGRMKIEHAKLRVPASLYPSLIGRLKSCPLDEGLTSFLGARCDRAFLHLILEARPDILSWAADADASGLSSGGKLLLAALTSCDLLPEASRAKIVKRAWDHSITWLDASPLKIKILQQIFTADEFQAFAERFRKEWLGDIPNLLDGLRLRFSSDDEIGLYRDFKDNVQCAQQFYADESLEDDLSEFFAQLDAYISWLEDEKSDASSSAWRSSMPTGVDVTPLVSGRHDSTIFDDVDD